jgi:hypothetical protein
MSRWTLGTYDVGDSKESSFISVPVMLGISGGELMWRRVLFSTKCSLLNQSVHGIMMGDLIIARAYIGFEKS